MGVPSVLIATLLLSACDSDPVPGTLTATVVSPHGPEGAAYLTLFGPGTLRVSALDARIFSHSLGDTVHVVVVGFRP
jgi:hypothetical protein